MKHRYLLPLLCFTAALTLAPAYAQDAATTGSAPSGRGAEFCKNNPATCQKMQERKKECDANPQQCEQLKQERQARMAKMKQACDANPEQCQKKKDAWRQRMDQRAAQRQQPPAPAQ
ncbi:MAG TPA: hypothetical protein VHE37_11180 [Nevskiaceae bacterium]|nr:hypothetical protein [Nevskiaceae bacterium]